MTTHRRDMRAADADRERVAQHLRKAAEEGRLSVEEFDNRLGLTLNAQTYGQLDALVGDLPPSRTLTNHPTLIQVGLQRRPDLPQYGGRVRRALRSSQRPLIAAALAAAAAAPLTAAELRAFKPPVHIPQAGAQSRPMPTWMRYDLREENNPNAPHPPVYYVLKANAGKS